MKGGIYTTIGLAAVAATLSGCCLLGQRCAVPYAELRRFETERLPGAAPGPQQTPPGRNGETPQTGEGPRFPGSPPTETTLEMTVDAPRRVQAGSRVTLAIAVRNTGTAPAKDLAVFTQLSDELPFPGKQRKTFFQELGELPAGQTRSLAITLQSRATGTFCTEFSLKQQDREVLWKSVCVAVEAKQYSARLTLPALRTVGGRVEPTIHLSNTSSTPLAGMQVVLNFAPRELQPREASRGVKQERSRLVWDVGGLKPGEVVQLQAELECLAATDEACLSLDVTADHAPADSQSACLKIVRAETLDMRIADTADLLQVGDQTDLVVGVLNVSRRKVAGERLTVRVPDHLQVVSAAAWQGKRELAVKSVVRDGAVSFAALPELAPQSEFTFRVRVKAVRSGDGVFRAVLGSPQSPLLELEEHTTVNP